MGSTRETEGQIIIIKDYLSKFKKTASRTLARKIFRENAGIFISEERVYSRVRFYRGALGVKKPKVIYPHLSHDKMPESSSKRRDVFVIPKAYKKVGVIGDVHIPYHDKRAVEAAVNHLHKEKIDALFINGDLLDFYMLSAHEKDPRAVKFKDELEAGKQFFEYLREIFPDIPIYFIPGNHENRFERFLKVNAAVFLDIEEFRLDVLLQVAKYGITYVPFRTFVQYGDLLIEHGDKIPGAGGVVPARTALLRFKRNILVNHFHKTSDSTQRIMSINEDEEIIRGYSLGCLCEISPEYLEVNEWNHGFALLTLVKGKTRVENIKVVNGVPV